MNVLPSPTKTYATFANAEQAIVKAGLSNHRYVIAATPTGRFFPVFIGTANLDVIHLGFAVVA